MDSCLGKIDVQWYDSPKSSGALEVLEASAGENPKQNITNKPDKTKQRANREQYKNNATLQSHATP